MQGVNRSKGCLWSGIKVRMIKARSRKTPGKMKSAGRITAPHNIMHLCTAFPAREQAEMQHPPCHVPVLPNNTVVLLTAPVLRLLARHRTAPNASRSASRAAAARPELGPRGQGALRQRRCSWLLRDRASSSAGCVLGSSTEGFLLQKAPKEEGLY